MDQIPFADFSSDIKEGNLINSRIAGRPHAGVSSQLVYYLYVLGRVGQVLVSSSRERMEHIQPRRLLYKLGDLLQISIYESKRESLSPVRHVTLLISLCH